MKIPIVLQKLPQKIYFFLTVDHFLKNKKKIGMVSVRAGNVIGGGDWSENRIVPDLIKSIIFKTKFIIRVQNQLGHGNISLICLMDILF